MCFLFVWLVGLLWVCCCLFLSLWISPYGQPAKYKIFTASLEVNEPMPTGKKKSSDFSVFQNNFRQGEERGQVTESGTWLLDSAMRKQTCL